MKKLLINTCMIILLYGLISADHFEKDGKYLTLQYDMNVTTRPFSKPFGFSFGYGILNIVEVGATFIMHFWSGTQNYTLSVDIFYHFTNPKEKLILFAGFSAGYDYFNFGTFDDGTHWPSIQRTFIFPVLGLRYCLNRKLAISLKYARSFTEQLGSNLFFGVMFSL